MKLKWPLLLPRQKRNARLHKASKETFPNCDPKRIQPFAKCMTVVERSYSTWPIEIVTETIRMWHECCYGRYRMSTKDSDTLMNLLLAVHGDAMCRFPDKCGLVPNVPHETNSVALPKLNEQWKEKVIAEMRRICRRSRIVELDEVVERTLTGAPIIFGNWKLSVHRRLLPFDSSLSDFGAADTIPLFEEGEEGYS